MIDRFRRKPLPIDIAIQGILIDMQKLQPDSDEYAKLLIRLGKLYEMKALDAPQRVSPDTVWTNVCYLLGIVVIVAYEQKHVFVSRAQAFLRKPK